MTLSCPLCFHRFKADAASGEVPCPLCDAVVPVPSRAELEPATRIIPVTLPPLPPRKNLWARFGLACLGILAVLFALCGGAGYVFYDHMADPEFVAYDSAEGRFHIEFPGKPFRANPVAWGTDGISSFPMVAYERTWPDEAYAIAWRDLTEEELQIGADAILDLVVESAFAFNSIITNAQRRDKLTVQGHPAVEVVTAVSLSHGKGILRVIVAGKRLYVLSVAGGWIQDDSTRAKRFLNSLVMR